MYPNVSECVKTGPNKPENVEKLRENVEKLREHVGVGGMAEPFKSAAPLSVPRRVRPVWSRFNTLALKYLH